MWKKSNRRQYVNDELFGVIAFLALCVFFKYWPYILSIIVIMILYKIVIFIRDKALFSSFKETEVYYQGKNSQYNLQKSIQDNDSQYRINCYKRGIYGEKNVLYTLTNITDLPMYIMYDVSLQFFNHKAQIDFILVTKKTIYILETKNLIGNIDIEEDGTFTRRIDSNKKAIKNPFTQNNIHANILKSILKKEKLSTKIVPLVVLANDESYIHYKEKNNEYKKNIIRNDKLYEVLKDMEKRRHVIRQKEKIEKICKSILKYKINNQKEEEVIINELKEYRKKESVRENISAYMVYTYNTIYDLVAKRPLKLEDLNNISGLGEYKIKKYGENIIKIINE